MSPPADPRTPALRTRTRARKGRGPCRPRYRLLARESSRLGLQVLRVQSRAPTRDSSLLRPERAQIVVGRPEAVAAGVTDPVDLSITIADGLSASAVHARSCLALARRSCAEHRLAPWPDRPGHTGQGRPRRRDRRIAAGARLALILLGERPGLSTPDSLGLYLTYAPRPRRQDGERNCISNVHVAGLSAAEAAARAAWLIREAFARSLTGVAPRKRAACVPLGRSVQARGAEIVSGRLVDPREVDRVIVLGRARLEPAA